MRGDPPVIEPLFDRVWSIRQAPSMSRAFIFEFDDHLLCMEAPLDSPTGESLVAAIRGRWPNKPIRYAVASHYHPHYTGGLRAFIAEGAVIVTSPGNESFMRGLAERPFTLQPDALARAARRESVKPRIEIASDPRVFEDRRLRVEFYDIGAASDHTDEFLIAFVPAARAVFHGDLGAAREDGALLGKSRLASMVRACRERGFGVDWLLQSWPLEGCRDRAAAKSIEP